MSHAGCHAYAGFRTHARGAMPHASWACFPGYPPRRVPALSGRCFPAVAASAQRPMPHLDGLPALTHLPRSAIFDVSRGGYSSVGATQSVGAKPNSARLYGFQSSPKNTPKITRFRPVLDTFIDGFSAVLLLRAPGSFITRILSESSESNHIPSRYRIETCQTHPAGEPSI